MVFGTVRFMRRLYLDRSTGKHVFLLNAFSHLRDAASSVRVWKRRRWAFAQRQEMTYGWRETKKSLHKVEVRSFSSKTQKPGNLPTVAWLRRIVSSSFIVGNSVINSLMGLFLLGCLVLTFNTLPKKEALFHTLQFLQILFAHLPTNILLTPIPTRFTQFPRFQLSFKKIKKARLTIADLTQ